MCHIPGVHVPQVSRELRVDCPVVTPDARVLNPSGVGAHQHIASEQTGEHLTGCGRDSGL